jgi:hypothetical protein
MRHQEVHNTEAFDVVDLATRWPDRAAELGIPAEVKGETAAPDMPAAAGGMMVAVYVALMGAFALAFGHGGPAGFVILIGTFFVGMFFAVPLIFLRLEDDGSRRPSLTAFLEQGIDTATGRISGGGALVQMLIVPLLLACAILAIGIINLVL